MNNILCLISQGAWGCPKVKVGQKWFFDDAGSFAEEMRNKHYGEFAGKN